MGVFAFDLETRLICPGLQAPPIAALGFQVDDGQPEIVRAKDPAFRRIVEASLTGGLTWTGHNARFDFACLLSHEPEWVTPIFDLFRADRTTCTLVREKLIRIARGDQREKFDLKTVCEAYELGLPLDKEDPWRLKYGTLEDVPVEQWPEEARAYLHLDAHAAYALHTAQERYAPLLVDQWRQARSALWLYLLSCWGVRTDPEQQARSYAATLADLQAAEALAKAEGLVRANGTKDTKAAKARLEAAYAAQGRPAPKTATNQTSLDFEACEGSGDPVLAAYTNFAQAGTLLGKIDRLKHPLIQAGYDSLKATGRTSCYQGADPKPGQAPSAHGSQMQNPPQLPGVREIVVSRAGSAIVSIDFETDELRKWGQCCKWILGYSRIVDVLNDPARCPHVEMGALLRNMPLPLAYSLKGDERKDLRGMAKGPNFGLPGGMGPARLIDYCRQGYGQTLSMAQAQHACRAWREAWPEAQPYLDHVAKLVGPRGGKATITQFMSGRVRGGVGFCDAANGFFQGLASDAAKAAGWALFEEMYEKKGSPLYGCRPLAYIHDEFLLEIPLSRLHEASARAAEVQIAAAQPWTPDVQVRAAPAAMLRWSKSSGDPVFNARGELIPIECSAKYKGLAPAAWHREWWLENRESAA